MHSLRPGLHWSQKICIVSLISFVSLHDQVAFATDGTQCTSSLLLRTSTPALRTRHEDLGKTIHDLASLRLRLDLAKVNGSNAIELTALEADFEKKERELVQYLETRQIMTRDELRGRLKRAIAQLQNQRQAERRENDRVREDEGRRQREQENQLKDSVIDGFHAIFHRIEPGSFKMGGVNEMGREGQWVDVTLTQPFEMMATPTTQIIWQIVAELANARFGNKYMIDPNPSKFKGETRPVEKVSYDDVQTWLRALNELSQVGEPSLADLIRGHKQGDVYRLPTEAEWEFVVRG